MSTPNQKPEQRIMPPPASAYFIAAEHRRRLFNTRLSVLVDNESGVLARVIGSVFRTGVQHRKSHGE